MVQVLCISEQYVLCVLLHYRTSCICYQVVASCSSDDNGCWILDIRLLVSNSPFLPSALSYIFMQKLFFYLLMVCQGPSRTVHALVSYCCCFCCYCGGGGGGGHPRRHHHHHHHLCCHCTCCRLLSQAFSSQCFSWTIFRLQYFMYQVWCSLYSCLL